MTRKKLIKVRKIKYSKGYLDEIDEIIFQDIEEKNMSNYAKNPYQVVQILVQVVQILVMVVLVMIP